MERKQLIEEIMANINAMKNRMHVKIMQQGKKNRIPHSQWFVLSIIEANKNIGIKDISTALSITSSAATQLVDALVESGYAVKKQGAQDRRSCQLHLSKKGKKCIRAMRQQHIKNLEGLFSPLGTAELKIYLALHKKILSNITK